MLLGTVDCVNCPGTVVQTNSPQIGTAVVLRNHILAEIAALVAQNQISTTQIGPTNNTTNISLPIDCEQICNAHIGTDCILCTNKVAKVAKDIVTDQIGTNHIWKTHIPAHVDIYNSTTQIGTNSIFRTHIQGNIATLVVPTQISP